MAELSLFIPLTKIDAEKRVVYGVATAETLDRSGEICDYASTKPFYEKWSRGIAKVTGGKSLGNLRAMHGKIAAGKLIDINFNDGSKQIEVAAKVVDNDEWKKVEEGVYTGFSHGGRYVKKWTGTDGVKRYTAEPSELSLVDYPCVPEATFEVLKADGGAETRHFIPKAEPQEKDIAPRAWEIGKAQGLEWEAAYALAKAEFVERGLHKAEIDTGVEVEKYSDSQPRGSDGKWVADTAGLAAGGVAYLAGAGPAISGGVASGVAAGLKTRNASGGAAGGAVGGAISGALGGAIEGAIGGSVLGPAGVAAGAVTGAATEGVIGAVTGGAIGAVTGAIAHANSPEAMEHYAEQEEAAAESAASPEAAKQHRERAKMFREKAAAAKSASGDLGKVEAARAKSKKSEKWVEGVVQKTFWSCGCDGHDHEHATKLQAIDCARDRLEKDAAPEIPEVTAANEALEALQKTLGVETGAEEDEAVEKRDFTQAQRDKAADEGDAMPDGSFPIKNRGDLKNAIKLCGKAKDPAAAKRHIMKRAKALGATDELPDDWKAAEKAAEAEALKKMIGEEVWDAARAAQALDILFSLRAKEAAEPDNEAGQVASLDRAIVGVKEFIASEIMEDNSADADPLAAAAKAYLAKRDPKDSTLVQALYDCAAELGASRSEMEESVEKVAAAGSELSKLASENETLKSAFSTMTQQIGDLQKAVETLKAQPAPAKAVVFSVTKEADGQGVEKSAADDLVKQLQSLSPDQRATELMKLALRVPVAAIR